MMPTYRVPGVASLGMEVVVVISSLAFAGRVFVPDVMLGSPTRRFECVAYLATQGTREKLRVEVLRKRHVSVI
jgi:hypothetical protein